ncbi:MAG: hypothetical protein IKJ41_01330 [Clostridia bacterium]|nr:hypothetical protein [Clostridia bacterium]
MKKTIAILLAASTLFLCSCTDKNNGNETTTAEQTTSSSTNASDTTKNSNVEYINEWGIDSLPEDFPVPPAGAYNFEYEQGEANEEYASDWVRIQFTCPENEIYRFTNDLLKAGYIGGAKKIGAPTTYFRPGFNGFWQNGKNYIRVAASQYGEDGSLTLLIDIAECKDNFPMVLTSIFPKFNGYTKNSGLYNEYDENKNRLDNEFIGSLNAQSWAWDFGFENAFVGVTEEDLENYVNDLVNAEFAGKSTTSVTDGCTVISYDLVKEIGDKTYGVFIAYNQILKTMDIAYTNNIYLYVQN